MVNWRTCDMHTGELSKIYSRKLFLSIRKNVDNRLSSQREMTMNLYYFFYHCTLYSLTVFIPLFLFNVNNIIFFIEKFFFFFISLKKHKIQFFYRTSSILFILRKKSCDEEEKNVYVAIFLDNSINFLRVWSLQLFLIIIYGFLRASCFKF